MSDLIKIGTKVKLIGGTKIGSILAIDGQVAWVKWGSGASDNRPNTWSLQRLEAVEVINCSSGEHDLDFRSGYSTPMGIVRRCTVCGTSFRVVWEEVK